MYWSTCSIFLRDFFIYFFISFLDPMISFLNYAHFSPFSSSPPSIAVRIGIITARHSFSIGG